MSQQILVLVNGSVYSPEDPFATAMLLQGPTVSWVGSDSGAQSILDPSMDKLNLDGRLATPGFVLGATRLDTVDQARQLAVELPVKGYTALTAFTPSTQAARIREVLEAGGLSTFIYIDGGVQDRLPAHGVFIDPQSDSASLLLEQALDTGMKISFRGTTLTEVDRALELILAVHGMARIHAGFRIDGVTSLTDRHIDLLANSAVAVGFSAEYDTADDSLRRAISAGVTVLLGSDPLGDPVRLSWDLVRSTIIRLRDRDRISARAAFNAMTRGVYRALGISDPVYGQLVTGSPADFVLWEAEELMVQTPDSRVTAWSTDPRARIPLLPLLGGGDLPECTATYRRGQLISSKRT